MKTARRKFGTVLSFSKMQLVLTVAAFLSLSLSTYAGGSLILSRRADFLTEDRNFTRQDVLYMRVLTTGIDSNKIKDNEFRLKPESGGDDVRGSFANLFNGSFAAQIPLSSLSGNETRWEVRARIRDDRDGEFEARVNITIAANQPGVGEQLELRGRIDQIGVNSLLVSGRTVFVDAATKVFDSRGNTISFASLRVGQTVEVKSERRNDANLWALRITIEDPVGENVEARGKIETMASNQIVVSALVFFVDDRTVILDSRNNPIRLGDLRVGQVVQIRAERRADGSLLAMSIKVEEVVNDEVEVTGTIRSKGSNSLVVLGLTFSVDGRTAVLDDRNNPISFADLRVGELVQVRADRQPDGTLLATRIKVEEVEDDEIELTGTISSKGGSSLVVLGLTFNVDLNTVILDDRNNVISFVDLQVGQVVQIRADRRADGMLLATRIKLEDEDEVTLFVPIVLSASGMNNSSFTSELILTNRGSTTAIVNFTYNPSFGGGGGSATDTLLAGQQQVFPDAIEYLKSVGIPIPDSGNRGGTLRIRFSNIRSSADVRVTVRTLTRVETGRAGLSYPGLPTFAALTSTSYLCGLRQDANDRSNVAIQNAGTAADGDIVIRLTVFSGNPAAPQLVTLPNITLSPGRFEQINGILASNGMAISQGYVRVERISGTAPYFAYAVINDQANSDGSFVPPQSKDSLVGRASLTLPVIVETSAFSSELIVTNWSPVTKKLRCSYVSDAIQTPDKTARFALVLLPGQQVIFPHLVQVLRAQGVLGLGAEEVEHVGVFFASIESGDLDGVSFAARTSTGGSRGRYGLYYTAVPNGQAASTSAWLYGLQENGETRTNLGLVNTGEVNNTSNVFQIELFDGVSGQKVRTLEGITLNAKGWMQIGKILSLYAPGTTQAYARIIRTGGSNPFITYAVVNDGAEPGTGSSDGAFVTMEVTR